MSLLWPEEQPAKRGKRWKPNPKPRIPKTNWKPATEFPSLEAAPSISFDVETYDPELDAHGPGWGRGRGHILGISMSTPDGFDKYFPIRHQEGYNHNPAQILAYVGEQLGRHKQVKVAHNALYDMGWLEHEGVKINGKVYCTMTAEKLIHHAESASLEATARRYVGEGKESTALYDWAWEYWGKGHGTPAQKRNLAMQRLREVPSELAAPYAESDTRLPLQILPEQFSIMEDLGLLDVFNMECDLLPILVQMRLAGVSVDLNKAEEARDFILNAADDLQKQANDIAGTEINTGSSLELAKVFDKLSVRYPLTEKGNPSFKGEFLKTVEHPFAKIVVDLEELKKYNSTFIENAILGSQVNGKIHGQFNPMVAVTGRMSASNPNLQQVPSRNELAKMVRAIFIPDEGHDHWRKYDYSSIESRILAHFAVGQGATELRKEYRDNPDTDYHNFTQDMIKRLVGLELPRKHVKNVNFAGIYGASEKKLRTMMGLSEEEAETFFSAYHDGLPYVKGTMNHMSQLAEEDGFTTTIMGRRATFDYWEPKHTPRGQPRPTALRFDDAVRAYGPSVRRAHLHKALNYTIQGSAADLMKAAMVKCHKDGIFDATGFPRLVVHDELDWSVAPDWSEDGFEAMRHTMETAVKFRIPVRVDGEWGPNWSELYDLK